MPQPVRIRFDHESPEFIAYSLRLRIAVEGAERLTQGLMEGRIPGERFEVLIARLEEEIEEAGALLRAHLRRTFKDTRWERPTGIEPPRGRRLPAEDGRLFVLRTRNLPGSP